MVLTFLCVCIGWVFFRATTFSIAANILRRMFVNHHGDTVPIASVGLWYTVALVAFCHAFAQSGMWKRFAIRLPGPVLGFGYATVLSVSLLLAPDAGKAFIYFQF